MLAATLCPLGTMFMQARRIRGLSPVVTKNLQVLRLLLFISTSSCDVVLVYWLGETFPRPG